MAEQAYKLEVQRAAVHDMDIVLDSASFGVEKFLEQLKGKDKLEAALKIATVLGAVIEADFTDEEPRFYAIETADPEILDELAEARKGLRYVADLATVGVELRDMPIN